MENKGMVMSDWMVGVKFDFIDNGEISIKDVYSIYKKMVDESSRDLFINRLMYILTLDCKYRKNVLKYFYSDDMINRLKQAPYVGVFGAGVRGKALVNAYPEINYCGYIDNNKEQGSRSINDFPVYDLETFVNKYPDATIVITICCETDCRDVYMQLLESGVEKERIVVQNDYKKQYFDFFEAGEREVFVDVGVWDGSTSVLFAEWCNGKYDKIFAFEPDIHNYENVREHIKLPNFIVFNKGLYSENKKVFFESTGNDISRISSDGKECIEVATLDSMLKDERVTFIKMDIEGAELEALKGAKEIIQAQKPKLAISIYHKPEDIIEIPKLILEMNGEYQLAIRHYRQDMGEMVLYAW